MSIDSLIIEADKVLRTLFASHTVWDSEQAFADWTQSGAFRKAHMAAGQSPRDFYLGPPQLELFEAVL